ncbi:hypothetical protein EST38_g12515 [Candolleomyces aberdarensis]|uniref:Cation/H+ exchanger transmembrane domain-containing protein n=1 Tax=Candolleomyces aberdarensis TaxID=2316362 RepID=A0A4Q2D305_9AGAR|nr:hypothetical protein EST38_g12515 [Candolleomyces aberdarensis]
MIAGVIANLVPSSGASIHWSTIARPILVSVAFALGTPVLALIARRLVLRRRAPFAHLRHRLCSVLNVNRTHIDLLVIVLTLLPFVATSHLAGTSELFGAYLAGAFLGHVFAPLDDSIGNSVSGNEDNPILKTFTSHISNTLLHPLLSPLFFASIGASIPVDQLFTVHLPTAAGEMVKSHRVVWRGIVYSLLMIFAKAVSGVWVFVFWKKAKRERNDGKNQKGDTTDGGRTAATSTLELEKQNDTSHANAGATPDESSSTSGSNSPDIDIQPRTRSRASTHIDDDDKNGKLEKRPDSSSGSTSRLPTALLLGLAMVARGEIALVVAQLARPLLVDDQGGSGGSEEPYIIVMWAILLTTFGGALGVGFVVRWMKGRPRLD